MTDQIVEMIRSKKCCICNNILSVPPLMVVSEDGSCLCCGRCKDIKRLTFARCTFYEDILKCLTFPCIYKKCNKSIAWGQVEEHERSCTFRTICCPMYFEKCHAFIEVEEMENHFAQKHSDNIQNGSVMYNLTNDRSVLFLLLVDGEKFLVYLFNYLLEPFSAIVYSFSPCKRFTEYNIKLYLSKNNDNLFISFDNQNIVEYDERKHCYRCLSEKCNARDHRNSQIYCNTTSVAQTRKTICTNFKRNYFGNLKSVKCSIEVIPNKQLYQQNNKIMSKVTIPNVEQLIMKATKYDENNNFLRQYLECPICSEYMLAPIYNCQVGHAVCNACRPKLTNCPCCNRKLSGYKRNYILEHLVEGLELPCQNEKFGCIFSGKVKEVRCHEVSCSDHNKRL